MRSVSRVAWDTQRSRRKRCKSQGLASVNVWQPREGGRLWLPQCGLYCLTAPYLAVPVADRSGRDLKMPVRGTDSARGLAPCTIAKAGSDGGVLPCKSRVAPNTDKIRRHYPTETQRHWCDFRNLGSPLFLDANDNQIPRALAVVEDRLMGVARP